MADLGPWEPGPRLVAAVSGGADSTALGLLAAEWVRHRGGVLHALIVDHGLRAESAAEAALTRHRLAVRGIAAQVATIHTLPHGPALPARARTARYSVLRDACAALACPHLLLGHHAADQAETVMLRALGGSTGKGLAAMPALADGPGPRLLRPLLGEPPAVLRDFLRAQSMPWVEDPSNGNPAALRARLRAAATPAGVTALAAAATRAGRHRAAEEAAHAAELACGVSIHPEGFALLSARVLRTGVLSAVWRAIGGGVYPPPTAALAALARAPQATTLAGVRLLPAGRLGPGWLVVREERAVAPPIAAADGMTWDGRFRLLLRGNPSGLTIGALGDDAARFRGRSSLPSVVLRVLPAVRAGNLLAVVPHLDYRDAALCTGADVVFHPPVPVAGAPFVPVAGQE